MSAAAGALARRDLGALRESVRGGVLGFCRDLVRIPSPSGGEEAAARRAAEEMKGCGCDEVEIDAAGNAIGVLRADASDPLPGAVLLNAHLDHVDAGETAAWPHPPFEGVLADGKLWGRGATDTKSAVAAQVRCIELLRDLGRDGARRRRDVIVAAVVQEEVGGLGTAALVESGRRFAHAVIGEPSSGSLAYGHRGRVEVEVSFQGRSAHASRPDLAVNPHASLARFVQSLDELPHDSDARFGRSSAAPTLVRATPASPNVTPSEVTLTLDWRHVPSEEPAAIRARVLSLAERAVEPGVRAHVATPTRTLRSWTGVERRIERVSRAFAVETGSAPLLAARRALQDALRRPVPLVTWDFASDGGWLAAAGVPCVGYGPGTPSVMHAVDEHVEVEALVDAVIGYAALAMALGEHAA